jgi:uncharacterized protein YkwD
MGLLGLTGCSSAPQQPAQSSFYRSLASPSAEVDAATATAMISAYRRNKGLAPLVLDSDLQAIARAEAAAMARADKPSSAEAVKGRLAAAGFSVPGANLSAGYHTLPEAFSGWRESPQHDRVMLDGAAKRMGIATAYAPGSKYKVYWALVVAGDRR